MSKMLKFGVFTQPGAGADAAHSAVPLSLVPLGDSISREGRRNMSIPNVVVAVLSDEDFDSLPPLVDEFVSTHRSLRFREAY
jgi:hypothetical protein